MLLEFFMDGKLWATRTRDYIPRKGEEIRFKNKCYSIDFVLYVEDEPKPRVAICISSPASS